MIEQSHDASGVHLPDLSPGARMAESAARIERYDFCLSFAAEQRAYVEEVAWLLRDADLRVFYDSFESSELLGTDLYVHLDEIYNRGSRYCVLFASEAYVRRAWSDHERSSAQDRAFRSRSAYLLPVRFDDAEIPGLRETIGHVDARVVSPAALVQLLITKLRSAATISTISASILVLAADIRDDLEHFLGKALERCRLEVPPDLIFESAGRTVVVVPESLLSTVDVTTTLVNAIEALASKRPRARLRIAVHRAVVPTEHLEDCVDVATTVEAAVSSAVSDAFDVAPRAHCVVVATQRVYDAVVRPGRGGSNPSLYQLVVAADGTGLHVRVPGYPRLPRPASSGPPSPPVGSAHQVNHFTGDVHAEQIGNRYYGGTRNG